ncbi:MAG: GNAT family N-acetyltransferase [Candidatus Zixiibacteriota bacterium]
MSKKDKHLPTRPTLVGKKLFLRHATVDDLTNTFHWLLQGEPQSMTCRPYTFATAADEVEAHKKAARSERQQLFMIIRKEDKLPVGRVRFFDYNSLNRSAELGLIIDPDERRNGYAGEALKLLITYLFRYRGLNKVYAQTAEFNEASVKLLESLGFKRDGTLRDHHYFDGEFHNDHVYSLLAYELDW